MANNVSYFQSHMKENGENGPLCRQEISFWQWAETHKNCGKLGQNAVKNQRFLISCLFFLWCRALGKNREEEDAKNFWKEKFVCEGLTDMLDQLEISGCIMRLIKSIPSFGYGPHTRHAFTRCLGN